MCTFATDSVALVTGASRGLGKTIALKLGEQGVTVLGTATSDEGADKISQFFQENNIKGKGYCLNVTDKDQIKTVLKQMKEDFGAPLILVNNAGVARDNIFLRMTNDQWNEVIDTNLSAVFSVTKACIKPMFKARFGRVINITSVVGLTGNVGQANYSAAKAGLIGFTKSVAIEMAQFGITANCIAPGFIASDMTDEISNEQKEMIMSKIPAQKMCCADDIANAVLYLASEQAGYVTGETLHVNGGMYMG